jgi:BirA family biotin operon repressor/biotin-[acetyl-CoA-carboxylase] ligase
MSSPPKLDGCDAAQKSGGTSSRDDTVAHRNAIGDAEVSTPWPVDLAPAHVERALAERASPWGRPLVVTSLTASTNDDAKRAARDGAPEGAAFIADAQSGGRGRLGRTWFSPRGENLYTSIVLRPTFDGKRVPLVTLTAGLAVVDAVEPRVRGRRVGLKWPNDVYIDGRKVAGILSEAQVEGGRASWIVVGIGINVKTRTFPDDIAHRATSLAVSGATALDRGDLFADLTAALFKRIEMLRADRMADLIQSFSARDELAGKTVTIDGTPVTALGIAEDGALRVRRADGVEDKCVAGEVLLASAISNNR